MNDSGKPITISAIVKNDTFKRGWKDYKLGLTFPRSYDMMDLPNQSLYEMGRLAASCIQSNWMGEWSKCNPIAKAMANHIQDISPSPR